MLGKRSVMMSRSPTPGRETVDPPHAVARTCLHTIVPTQLLAQKLEILVRRRLEPLAMDVNVANPRSSISVARLLC